MPKIPITNPRKVKELSLIAQQCFEKIIGEPPNDKFRFHTPEEVEYTLDILSTMVRGHLKEITQEQFDLIEKKHAERKAQIELERNLMTQRIPELVDEVNSTVLENLEGKDICPRCESPIKNNFCYVCSLNVEVNKNE